MDRSDYFFALQRSLFQSIRLPLAMAGVMNPIAHTANELGAAFFDEPKKPAWGIDTVCTPEGRTLEVTLETTLDTPFCELLHFRQGDGIESRNIPRMLVIAPMSGHYATLLRRHVRILLPHFDVTITDWKDPRHIPKSSGNFAIDDYVDFIVQSFARMSEEGDFNCIAVCQPGPLALVAVALAERDGQPHPKSLTLIAAPIDTNLNPTHVNKLAEKYPISFFEDQLECVPPRYEGKGRVVYPAHLQLAGFMLPKMNTHLNAHVQDFVDRLCGNSEGTKRHQEFYDEFNAVMPLPQPYHLETLVRIFKEKHLTTDSWQHRGEHISLDHLCKVKLLGIEGELDDICGGNQTFAARYLAKNIPDANTRSIVIPGAGHYGAFQGKAFAAHGLPAIIQMAS